MKPTDKAILGMVSEFPTVVPTPYQQLGDYLRNLRPCRKSISAKKS